jgi:hypothetical protein
MNKPVFLKPKCAAAAPKAEAEPQRSPARTKKWADLQSALAQLLEAQALASGKPDPAGDLE